MDEFVNKRLLYIAVVVPSSAGAGLPPRLRQPGGSPAPPGPHHEPGQRANR